MGESSEEIVLSVEETNALRAKLGLKPLRTGGGGSSGGGGGGHGPGSGTTGATTTTSGTEELSLSLIHI